MAGLVVAARIAAMGTSAAGEMDFRIAAKRRPAAEGKKDTRGILAGSPLEGQLRSQHTYLERVATRYKSSERMSDRFPFPRGEESQIILDRSPDLQAELMLPSSRLSAFPDSEPSGEWKVFPDHSGGTVPDLHRLPFYALAGTQDLARASSTAPDFECQWDQNIFSSAC
jgi:hypothetical protein